MTTRKCRIKNYHPYIDQYIDDCRTGKNIVSEDILLACDYVEEKLNNKDVFIDTEKIDKAVELIEKYFEIKLLDWELFIIALIHCYYKSNDTVVFDTIFILMGRGNGKNGFISPIAWYLTTHYHGVKAYNVDIIANSQDQAETSFFDIYEVLERFWSKLKKFFYKTKEVITNLKTKSYIKYNTSNAKTKDGKRSACLIFDEIHGYESYDNIKVFTSGFGKKKHSRAFYITTNGNVREGVLDDMLAIAKDVLNGTIKNLGWLPLLYHIDSEEEALNPEMWHKANPSLKYFPELQKEMEKEFIQMKYQPALEEEFYTKRLNWPKGNRELQVTEWANIIATNKPLPELTGWSCTVGIDYASMRDWAAVNFHFRKGDIRYDFGRYWVCTKNPDLFRIKAPWREWDTCIAVDDVEIHAEMLTEYIFEMGQKYNIKKLGIDNYRYQLMKKALEDIGFDPKERKNVYLVRPSDIMKIQPVIDSCFNKQLFVWGDNPALRWATNNTKLILSGKKQGTDTGNYYYGKIESKSRKTDPFMALVHSMVVEDELGSGECTYYDLPVITL
ncbi:terminase large subunit domain-containing protein [Clostridium thermarum]|uniref:terminase large subunit domain-containing protein n=1 Tax=Clostridium thermarum TaxID=1716543 RepID=UPI001122A9D8|nr:terminase large subunit [Clostridium thermarum]